MKEQQQERWNMKDGGKQEKGWDLVGDEHMEEEGDG